MLSEKLQLVNHIVYTNDINHRRESTGPYQTQLLSKQYKVLQKYNQQTKYIFQS